jgi:hypothetical protein
MDSKHAAAARNLNCIVLLLQLKLVQQDLSNQLFQLLLLIGLFYNLAIRNNRFDFLNIFNIFNWIR